MVTRNEQQRLCEHCQRQIGATDAVQPHKYLLRTGSMIVSYVVGTVEEEYYRCGNCGREWLHETGSLGFGWVC